MWATLDGQSRWCDHWRVPRGDASGEKGSIGTMPEARTVWAMTPTSNPRKGVRGTLNLEGDTLRFTPAATGHIGFRVAPNEVVAARKAPSSPVIELHLSSYPKEVLLYFAEPSSSLDWTSLYDLAFADVFLGDAVKQWLWAILHPQPERVTPGHCCIGRPGFRRRDWRDEIAETPSPLPSAELRLRRVPVPAGSDHAGGPVVPAVRSVVPGCGRASG